MTYKTGGLTGVLTFPDFASTGHGTRVVEAATKHIAEAGADIGLTTCKPALRFFYARAGWIPLTNTTLLFGDVTSPVAVDELVLTLFVSEKARGDAKVSKGDGSTWARTPGSRPRRSSLWRAARPRFSQYAVPASREATRWRAHDSSQEGLPEPIKFLRRLHDWLDSRVNRTTDETVATEARIDVHVQVRKRVAVDVVVDLDRLQ